MWIYYKTGFISVVQDTRNKDNFLVRSRSLKHLIDFAGKQAPIRQTPEADYDFRCIMPKIIFAERLIEKAGQINYPNFKDSITDLSYKELLSQLWLTTKLWF